MHITDLLQEEMIRIGSAAADKDALLSEIADLAASRGADRDVVFQGLARREKLGSTGFGNGIAIPHCRLADVDEFLVGFVIPAQGIGFDAADGKEVRIAAFIIAPEKEKSGHIQLLSSLSRVLHRQETVDGILKADSPAQVRQVILDAAGNAAAAGTPQEHCLITIHVQDEGRFNDIIRVFSEAEDLSIAVTSAEDASRHLSRMPLFAGLWERRPEGFHRVIRVVVRKALGNDLVRRIGLADEELNRKPGVLVTVQDLVYACGSLYL